MAEGRGFVTANKAIADSDEKLYAEISIYVRTPEGYEVDEDVLEDGLKAAVTDAFNKAVAGAENVADAPVEVEQAPEPAVPTLEIPADPVGETPAENQ